MLRGFAEVQITHKIWSWSFFGILGVTAICTKIGLDSDPYGRGHIRTQKAVFFIHCLTWSSPWPILHFPLTKFVALSKDTFGEISIWRIFVSLKSSRRPTSHADISKTKRRSRLFFPSDISLTKSIIYGDFQLLCRHF